MDEAYAYIPGFPDASLRRALTLTDIIPVILCYYVHAVLAIVPNTYWLRVALLPVTEWFVWNAAVTLDFSKYLASTLGLENPVRVSFLNMAFDVSVSSSTFPVSCLTQAAGSSLLSACSVGHRTQVYRMDAHHR